MSETNRDLFVNAGKYIMKNKQSYKDINLDDSSLIREFRFKDIMFSCERSNDKIKPQFLEFDCCGEQYQLHADGKFKKEFFDSASFEVALNRSMENNDEDIDDEFEDSFYSRMIIEDQNTLNILNSYIR